MKEVNFGNIIRSSKQVEDCIRRAQLAILNPSVDYQRFVDYKLPKEPEKLPLGSKRQYSFSRNVVCLEISGSTVPDLTVIDLPGLIKNVTEGDDPDSIVLIEKLVKENIKNDCLILLTITMKGEEVLRGGDLSAFNTVADIGLQMTTTTNRRRCSPRKPIRKAYEPSVRCRCFCPDTCPSLRQNVLIKPSSQES